MNSIRKLVVAVAAAAAFAGAVYGIGNDPADLGNRVWYDENKNGKQDVGEPGVNGVQADLYREVVTYAVVNGEVVATVVTPGTYVRSTTTQNILNEETLSNEDGIYTFGNLPVWENPTEPDAPPVHFYRYYVVFTLSFEQGDAIGYVFTTPNVDGNDEFDSDPSDSDAVAQSYVQADPLAWVAVTPVTVLSPGELDPTWDAGLILPGSDETAELGDRVWCDLNRDGIQNRDAAGDYTEPGMPNVTVNLYEVSDLATPLKTVQTSALPGAEGTYGFIVGPGTYVVQFVLPPGAAFTQQNLGGDDNWDSDAIVAGPDRGYSHAVTLADLESDITVDAGVLCGDVVCTRTLGYWKTHPEAWPVVSIEVGGKTYTKAEAIAWMKTPPKGDESINMFHQLVAAKLNLLVGSNPSCIYTDIANADIWLSIHPIGSPAQCGGWTDGGGALHAQLDAYNNGKLCAPHCDEPNDCDDVDPCDHHRDHCDRDRHCGKERGHRGGCDNDRDRDCNKDPHCSKDRGHRGGCDNGRDDSRDCGKDRHCSKDWGHRGACDNDRDDSRDCGKDRHCSKDQGHRGACDNDRVCTRDCDRDRNCTKDRGHSGRCSR